MFTSSGLEGGNHGIFSSKDHFGFSFWGSFQPKLAHTCLSRDTGVRIREFCKLLNKFPGGDAQKTRDPHTLLPSLSQRTQHRKQSPQHETGTSSVAKSIPKIRDVRSTVWEEELELCHLHHINPVPNAQMLIKFQAELIDWICSTQEVKDSHQPIGPSLSAAKRTPGRADSMGSWPQQCCKASENWDQ